jgi:hypothetical protein
VQVVASKNAATRKEEAVPSKEKPPHSAFVIDPALFRLQRLSGLSHRLFMQLMSRLHRPLNLLLGLKNESRPGKPWKAHR